MFRTLGAKLAAPFALFLLPIAFLLHFLVGTHERSIATARNELSGLPSIDAALELSNALVGWNGPNQTEAVHRAAAHAAVIFGRDAARWPEHAHTRAWLSAGAALTAEVLARDAATPAEAVKPLATLTMLIQAVADASELILDPDLDTYYLMDALINHQPAALAAIATLKREVVELWANGASGDSVIRQTEPYRQVLASAFGHLQRNYNALMRYNSVRGMPPKIELVVNRYFGSLKVIEHDPLDEPVRGEALFQAGLIEALNARTSLSKHLTVLLQARIERITSERNQQITIALAMFAFAAGTMLLLVVARIIRPVKQLTHVMRSLAGGNVDVQPAVLARGDEVGDMSRAVLVFRDNAILKQALEARARKDAALIALNAATLQRAERIAGMGNWRHDFELQTTTASPSFYDLLGFEDTHGPPRFSSVLERTDEADRNALRNLLGAGLEALTPVEGVIRYDHPRHGKRHLRVIIETEKNRSGQAVSIVGVVHDITALKDNELKLAARSEALAEAQAMGRIGNWSWRLGDSHINWSREVYQLLKLEIMPQGPRRADVLARCKGEGARALLDAEAEVMRTRGVKAVDVTIQRGDGSLADFTITSKAELNAQAAVIGVFGTIQDISERKNSERELEKLAYYDPLSGLANRALFQRAIQRAVEDSVRDNRGGALLMLDLDRFKEVNDSLGHQAGDELLVKVAERLTRILASNAFLARLGGDEFAAILMGCDKADAGAIAQRIINALGEPIRLSMGEVSIGTSIGIAMMPTDGASADELMGHADLALYRAKESGRACAEFFSIAFSDIAQDKIRLARDLSQAISNDQGLYLVYQPQVDLSSGAVTGFEALVRWEHPERGNIPPSEFVPVAESSKLICDLGLWVVRAACAQVKAWRDDGHPLREVAVNVSAAQFWFSELEDDIEAALREADIPPTLLCIEVTESVFARDAEGRVRKALDYLGGLGVKLALDDFGTGYSSLAYLNRFPFDKLKIDRMFIDHVDQHPERLKLLQGIVSMSKALGKRTIAEGAERLAEVDILRVLGCDMVQGYVYARPMRAELVQEKAAELEALAFARIDAAA
ncbi:MAG: EAL domain-containing protein [Bosea sp. (in: a-proteobacteria)]